MNQQRLKFQSLVHRAQQEPTPTLDVSDRVSQRIAQQKTPREYDWPTWSAAGLSVAAAIMMMAFVMQEGISWHDPLGDWISSLVLVMS